MPAVVVLPQPSQDNHAPDEFSHTFPPLTRSAVVNCSFSSWYPTFRRHSPKASVIKPLEPAFIEYLESDGLFVPEGSDAEKYAFF
jgi:hypothetical protein